MLPKGAHRSNGCRLKMDGRKVFVASPFCTAAHRGIVVPERQATNRGLFRMPVAARLKVRAQKIWIIAASLQTLLTLKRVGSERVVPSARLIACGLSMALRTTQSFLVPVHTRPARFEMKKIGV